MRILIVDDDPLAGEMASLILESAGHACQRVENAVEALEVLEQQPDLDLVVSDMNMPLVSGADLLAELRERGRMMPFVLLTGDDPQTLSGQLGAASAVLCKDASLEESLPALVERLAAGG
jgi:CheY-like chemotaxis protein